MAVEVFCKAEGKTIGEIEATVGAVVDAKLFVRGYRATQAAYSFAGLSISNHTQLVCPKCRNPLLFKQPPKGEGDNPTGVYAVLGNVKVA